MPIYEYQAVNPANACPKCRDGFEVLQGMREKPYSRCTDCGKKVKKIISWCRAAVIEVSDGHIKAENQINDYEKSGMWSHAAELADKHSDKTKDKNMKTRALENYQKAGYDASALEKHVKTDKK